MGEGISVVIPARNEARNIERAIRAVLADPSGGAIHEVIVVDGGSEDETVARSRAAGATVVSVSEPDALANPALLRNRGAAEATGERIVFLDADCEPVAGWLAALDSAHDAGAGIVSGAFGLPPGLAPSARCDYYAGWYHAHPGRPRGPTTSGPPGNLSIERRLFLGTSGFDETPSVAYCHEELRMQAELGRKGHRVFFEPAAVVLHYNRPGFLHLLARNYRWGSGAIEGKATTGAARFAWVYRFPVLPILLAIPIALPTAIYICWVWARAGRPEAVVWFPAILCARLAWGWGMVVGGIRWLLGRRSGAGASPARVGSSPGGGAGSP